MDGIVLVDKPAHMSSFGVVARIRRMLSEQAGKKVKVGHTGTLDPFATGLVILVVGKATKRAGEFSKLDKVYEATIRLGETSTTGDIEGEITPVSNRQPPREEIEQVIARFIGEIEQTPPAYSAIKINGERAYKLARKGKAVEMPTRKVVIYAIELLEYEYPELKIRTHVSSGTYIRTLAEDLGEQLEVGGYCSALRRTKVGAFTLEQAMKLDENTQASDISVLNV